ncbi:MAG: hypothetical protein BM563_07710 [Bacteroidetes bacterium MedPE-SWsnd-G1]|nr:MAG: hypothetical protein BM563_07710 [Bacteroidetes bacterium MedPE-SWsnd-G1]
MKRVEQIGIVLVFIFFVACKDKVNKKEEILSNSSIVSKVDDAVKKLNSNISNNIVVSLDHHRMALEEGVYTPPSVALIYSDSKINTDLLMHGQLIGIDLPFKVLCYTEPDTTKVSIAYTSADFIAKRHGVSNEFLNAYNANILEVISGLSNYEISESDLKSVEVGFGIFNMKSDFDFETTINNLRNIVLAQSDTKWFGNIDFQKEAKVLEVELNPTTLLLFGGPAPGGKAMISTPKIGLDAFCQKLLVYEDDSGEVNVAFNDIVDFAELYYGTSTKPQQLINQRLKMTFSKAISKK